MFRSLHRSLRSSKFQKAIASSTTAIPSLRTGHRKKRHSDAAFPQPSKPQRETAQTAVHLLKLRHIEHQRIESTRAQFGAEARVARRNEHTIVHANAVGGIAFFSRDANEREALKLRVAGHLFH